jgi:hypothetical protein
MEEGFKPNLNVLAGFEGKIKIDYNEFTQYLTLVLALDSIALTFSGIIKDQEHVDGILKNMLSVLGVKEEKEEKKAKK